MRFLACGVLAAFALVDQAGFAAESPRAPKKVAQTANFIVTAESDEIAREVAREAEVLRDRLARQWLGRNLKAGDGRALIIARVSESENSALTWPSADLQRPAMVWLKSKADELTGELLAHEIAHVVLCHGCSAQLPPWANEGVASREDSQHRKQIRQGILRSYVASGDWPSVGDLFDADKLPAADQSSYAVATSVVEFLLSRGSATEMLDFAVDGKRTDWDVALRRHYALENVGDLQRNWQRWVTQRLAEPQVALSR